MARKIRRAGGLRYAHCARRDLSDLHHRISGWSGAASNLVPTFDRRYASPSGWWNAANSLTMLSNYERATDDNALYGILSNSFQVAPVFNHHPNFENYYYDDTGWWTLAWIQAYDVTGDPKYLSMAETIFTHLTQGWNPATCGGGEYWAINSNYKNAIANELFLTVAAKLANRTTGTASATYLSWANKEWNWFKNSGMINSKNLINDGITPPTATPPCANNGETIWTYNQGVILGGLVELAQADNDPALVNEAQKLAHATLTSNLVNSDDILVESSVAGGDAPQFKGIFARNLMILNHEVDDPAYSKFLKTNANSILSKDQTSSHEFGALWQGPVDSVDATRQTSALDAIVGAVETQGHSSVGPIEANTMGGLEMFATDSEGDVLHNRQFEGSRGASESGNWTGWNVFSMDGVAARSAPVVAENGIREQHVFVSGGNGDVFTMSESTPAGGWGNWTDMGAASKGLTGLRAIYTYNGGLYLFGRNVEGEISYTSLSGPNGSWTGFDTLGGPPLQGGYVVGKNAMTGYLQVFGTDGRGMLWTNVQTGQTSWSGWSRIPAPPLQGHLAIARDLEGDFHLFGVDFGGTVWTNAQIAPGGGWQTRWQRLSSLRRRMPILPGFVCGINSNGDLQLFGTGADGHVYTLAQTNGAWGSEWMALGGNRIGPDLAVATTADGRLQIFGSSENWAPEIWSNFQTSPGGAWSGWEDFGGSGDRLYSSQKQAGR